MRRLIVSVMPILLLMSEVAHAQRYTGPDGRLRVALAKQPFSPTGTSAGPNTMANGIQQILEKMDAVVRIEEAALTSEEATEYGAWKRLGMALGHFADIVAKNEQDGFFTVGLLATCPSMPGLVAGLQHSGPRRKPLRIGMLWLDAHLTSTLLRPRVADRWVGCRWRSRPAGHYSDCGSTHTSIRHSRISTL